MEYPLCTIAAESNMALYKYLSPERTDILENGMVRFASPAELNDPFEFKPHINAIASEEMVQEGIQAVIPETVESVINSIPEELRRLIPKDMIQLVMEHALNTGKELISQTVSDALPIVREQMERKFEEEIGVFSVSEDPVSLLMWSHYAESHRGFVIELDEKSNFFNRRRSESDEMWHLRRVVYENDRPSVALSGVEDFTPYLTKGSPWFYEKEWRMMAPLKHADKIVGFRKEIHLFEFPAEAITAVIVGARMPISKVEEIKLILSSQQKYQHIKIRRAVIDTTRYQVNVEDEGS